MVPFCYFVTTFYRPPRDSWVPIAYIPLLSAIVLSILGYLPKDINFGPSVYPDYNMLFLGVFIALPLVILAIRGIYFLRQRLKTAETPLIHNQIIYLMAAIILLGVSAVSNFFVIGRQLPLAHLGNLIISGILAYAVLKHQLVDIKIFLRGGLVYGGLIVIFVAGYGLLLYLFHRWLNFELSVPTIALMAGIALVIAVAFYPLRNALRRRVEWLFYPKTYDYRRMLIEFSKKASNVIKIEELGAELTNLMKAAIMSKRVYLLLFESVGVGSVKQFVSEDTTNEAVTDLSIKPDSPISEWLRKENKLLFRESMDILPILSSLWMSERKAIDEAEIELFAPLTSRGKLLGILALAKKENDAIYDMGDIELINILTSEIAVAIENAQLHARIERQAITDELTELFNRRYLEERLGEEVERYSRYGSPFSLIMCDLDYFKNYNDAYGHKAGDILLRELANSIRKLVRNIDLVFRYGGDEFAIFLPHTNSDEAYIISERVRASIEKEMETRAIVVTISLGIASLPSDGITTDDIVRAADAALYHAKQSGGNRSIIFSQMTVSLVEEATLQFSDEKMILNTVHALVSAIDARDHYTFQHSRQVANYAVELGKAAGLSADKIAVLQTGALLHDVGKIGIPDDLLLKEEQLSPEEFEIVKNHVNMGVAIISHVPSLSRCVPVVLYHHERYDGMGYPKGLKGKKIPIEARIITVADAFSAMTSQRLFCNSISYDAAIEELRRCSGTQFDPNLVNLFIDIVLSSERDSANVA
jgi:diguanylate cyclase (GGDEF)-like protein